MVHTTGSADRHQSGLAKRSTSWRYGTVGSVLLSYDFLTGVPVGALAALSTLCSESVRSTTPAILIGIAGVGAAVATLVLTSMAVLLATITPAYRELLRKTPDGIIETARPFRWIVALAALSTGWAILAAGIIPLVEESGLLTFLIAFPAYSLLLWAVFGCIQATGQLIMHWENSQRADDVKRREIRAKQKRRSDIARENNCQ